MTTQVQLFANARRRSTAVPMPLPLILTSEAPQAVLKNRGPGGRPAWMPAVFGSRQDAESENPPGAARILSGFDLTRKVLSFGYFSLHQQRKVTRAPARKPLTLAPRQESKAFALARELLSFAGPKESNQRKGPLLVTSNPLKRRMVPRSFSDSPSWLGPKTPAIHGRRPPGAGS